jgi:hypothetical protein
MAGPSRAGACQAAFWVRSFTEDDHHAKPTPPGARRRPHNTVGRPKALSSLFHRRYVEPCESVNTPGSIDPPRSSWQTSGADDVSLNGPAGLDAVATDTHCLPEEVCLTV